jgi:hypothetical protein
MMAGSSFTSLFIRDKQNTDRENSVEVEINYKKPQSMRTQVQTQTQNVKYLIIKVFH